MRIAKQSDRLNVLLVGASGTGKSAFLSSLMEQAVESAGEFSEYPISLGDQTVHFYDSRGYGVKTNLPEKLAAIDAFIKEKYKEFLLEETKVKRDPSFSDQRIHLVVHFLSVSAHGMKDYDLSLLKLLHSKVNVITVIPKCDHHTAHELQQLREKIQGLIAEHKLDLFITAEVPPEQQPVALFSADQTPIDGKAFAGRILPAGTPLLDNDQHSDLRLFLRVLAEARQDLRETTHLHFYELYRSAMLSE